MNEDNTTKQPENPILLTVTVKSPNYVHFKGQAVAVTSYNKTGKFDVLGLHASFISLIQDSIIIYKPNKQKVSIRAKVGVMKVFKNIVQIFVGIELRSK